MYCSHASPRTVFLQRFTVVVGVDSNGDANDAWHMSFIQLVLYISHLEAFSLFNK